jgi:hypothetical protein
MARDPLAAIDQPPRVTVVDGEVVAIGEGIGVALTPHAARIAGERLIQAAERAEGDRKASKVRNG